MSHAPPSSALAMPFSVFRATLANTLPFREDHALLADLIGQAAPVLATLAAGYRASPEPSDEHQRAALHEGFALFHQLCLRAGLAGATPTSSLSLAGAALAALASEGLCVSPARADDLRTIAVEGYSAGRDELRERSLRKIAIEGQVVFAFAPRCFGVFLAGSHHPEQLGQLLDDVARQLFRAEARSVLLDVSRLGDASEDGARALVAFMETLAELGIALWIHGSEPWLDAWFAPLGVDGRNARRGAGFAETLARVLSAAGYELRARGRLGELIEKVRIGAR